jgi:uncharacterized cofD-like protein
MRLIKWLYPGIKVKRWFVLAFIGTLLIGIGLAVLDQWIILGQVEEVVTNFSNSLFGHSTPFVNGMLIIILGFSLTLLGVRQAVSTMVGIFLPNNEKRLVEIIYKKRNLRRGPKIVVIGGGTGLSVLLRGLKDYTSNITAIVTVADDGGSSGVLRDEYGILPPGDFRNCLVALADTESLMEELFQHRFSSGTLAGHSLGNLFLAAMTEIAGDFESAIREVSKVLAIRGQVLPSTLTDVVLCAELVNGQVVEGESKIPESMQRIKRVYLNPDEVQPVPEAIKAILEADAVILGPGSLYTSVIPNLLVKDMVEAMKKSRAPKIYACNIMTQPGETDDYTASEHVKAIIDHVGYPIMDYVIVNKEQIPKKIQKKYSVKGAYPVKVDIQEIENLGVKVVKEALVYEADLVRHDSAKLAKAIITLAIRLKDEDEKMKMIDFYFFNDNLKH